MTQDSHDEKRRKHMAVMDDKNKTMIAPIIYISTEPDTTHAGTWCDVADGGIPYVPQAAIDHIEDLEAKLAKTVGVIKHIINIAPEGDEDEWHIALNDAAEALAKIKGKTT